MKISIMGDLRDAINIMIHPKKYSYKTMNIKEGLVKYYKVMIIPMILAIILFLIRMNVSKSIIYTGPSGILVGDGILVAFELLFYIILIPIGIIVSAFLLQLIAGNVLNLFNGGYTATFSAIIYSVLPILLISWFLFIPPIMGIVTILIFIASIWELIIEILALAKLHNISAGEAFIGILISGIIWSIIFLIITVIIAAAFLGSILSKYILIR